MSPSAISRISLATSPLGISVRLLTNHELGPHAQLGRRHRPPPLRRPLALSHARLGWLLRDRLVRKNPDPHFPAPLDVPRQRDTRRLDLPVGHPPGLQRLQPVVTVDDGIPPRRPP